MSTAHGALEELRDVIGVLREGSPEPPQPTLAEIPALVDESRRAGMRVRCTLDLTADPALPAALGRAAYRIVQEGLTNARKHAPGAAVQVTISAEASTALVVEVVSRRAVGVAAPAPLALPGAGTGLVGLAERVELAGGELAPRSRRGGRLRPARDPPVVGMTARHGSPIVTVGSAPGPSR